MQEVGDQQKKKLKKEQDANTRQQNTQARLLKKQTEREERKRLHDLSMDKRIREREIRENWFKLDNAALIYPAIRSSQWNTVFRISATTYDVVKPDILQQALDDTLVRYPFFNVALCDGLFWHYFQELSSPPKIQKETQYPCRPFEFDKDKQIFRVLYMDNKISFESFHSLTDGGGAVRFFNTLIIRYFQLCGAKFDDLDAFNLNVKDLPKHEENEDAFKLVANKDKPRARKEAVAYAIEGGCENIQVLKCVTGIVEVDKLKEKAKSYGATINEFLTAVYFVTLLQEKAHTKKQVKCPVKISVPVNMRRFYASQTMRNFSQFLNMQLPIENENDSFEKIVEFVKNESKQITKENMLGSINANVRSERNLFVRLLPLSVKDFMLKLIYNRIGERFFTSTFTNIGLVKLPSEATKYIREYFVVLGATKLNRINLAGISYNNKCALTFSSRLIKNRIIENFFHKLVDLGLEVKLFSNIRGGSI